MNEEVWFSVKLFTFIIYGLLYRLMLSICLRRGPYKVDMLIYHTSRELRWTSFIEECFALSHELTVVDLLVITGNLMEVILEFSWGSTVSGFSP